MNEINRFALRRRALELLNNGYSKDWNCVKYNAHSTDEHEIKKALLCLSILKNGGAFLTECIFKTGGRADVMAIKDDMIIIYEIVKSETEQSLVEKYNKYPKGIKIEIIRC